LQLTVKKTPMTRRLIRINNANFFIKKFSFS
jgi:hypothetical protein